MDDSRIRSKTAPFSFENGLVRTGPYVMINETHSNRQFSSNLDFWDKLMIEMGSLMFQKSCLKQLNIGGEIVVLRFGRLIDIVIAVSLVNFSFT